MSTTTASLKVLIVVTSHATLGSTGKATGYYLSEVTHPYAALVEQGLAVDIASPKGGDAPLDPGSLKLDDPINKTFWENPASRAKLVQTMKLSDVDVTAYRAILFAGGHGTMWDFRGDAAIAEKTRRIYEQGGVVAAVCHGPAALVDVKLTNGRYLVDGKNVAAFSNAEEKAAGLEGIVPFLLESALTRHGGHYSKAGLWLSHVVVDDRLVTGQNPASATGVGAATAKLVRAAALAAAD